MPNLRLRILEGRFAVTRLEPGASVPDWALSGPFFTVSRTLDELSVLCEESLVPPGLRSESGWAGLKLEGPFEFTLTGILAAVLEPLKLAKIGIFAVSTFDTDYVLVKSEHLESAVRALEEAGHTVGG